MTALSFYHAHRLLEEKCAGRLKCMFACPTQAIRVRNNKARIISELCIDCGTCIEVCPENAFVPVNDELEDFQTFKYLIAVPSPVLYTQFGPDVHPQIVNQTLKQIGFDEVINSSRAIAEVGYALLHHIKIHPEERPMILSYCPPIVRLIQVNYPNLVTLITAIDVPREIIAKEIKQTYPQKLGLKKEQIGIIYISPCPAKVVSIRQPAEKEISWIDSAIPIKEIYNLILPEIMEIKKMQVEEKFDDFCYIQGWAAIDQISRNLGPDRCLAVSGIDHVRMILDDLEKSKLRHIDIIEAHACVQECLGGPFCVENPYISRHNSILIARKCKSPKAIDREKVIRNYENGFYTIEHPILPRHTRRSHHEIAISIKRMRQKERIYQKLPKKDCGLCGAPDCSTFAEDCAYGDADVTDCIFFSKK